MGGAEETRAASSNSSAAWRNSPAISLSARPSGRIFRIHSKIGATHATAATAYGASHELQCDYQTSFLLPYQSEAASKSLTSDELGTGLCTLGWLRKVRARDEARRIAGGCVLFSKRKTLMLR